MRVALTVPSLAREFGGPVEKALGLRAALRAAGAYTRLVGAGAGEDDGLPVIATVRGTPIPRSFRTLRWAIRSADVVHVLGFRDPVGTVAAWMATRAGVPYVLEPCGMHRPRLRSIVAKRSFDVLVGGHVVDGAALVIATSELERRELVDDGVPEARVRTRLNGLTLPDRELPARGRIRARFGLPTDAPLVLCIGRISRKKGLPDLVRAVTGLPSVHVLIAGPDAGDGTLAEISRAGREMNGRVHVETGGLWGSDKLAALADADCFALPSLTENFANAAAEAAAVGLPVVVSSACGVAEVLDRSAHRVISPGRIGELTGAIDDLLGPRARARAVGAAAALRARLDWPRLAEQQIALYEDVLRRVGRPTTR